MFRSFWINELILSYFEYIVPLKDLEGAWAVLHCSHDVNEFFIFFSDSFFDDQLNFENQKRFDPLTKEKKTGSSSFGTSKNNLSVD